MATATNKTYVVYGPNGEELKTLKTLAAAKKLADAEGGSVLSDGECVYHTRPASQEAAVEEKGVESVSEETSVTEAVNNVDKPVETYRLLTLMNIRKTPSMTAPKAGTVRQGTLVKVREVKNDWLCRTDGTYILFGNGEFAEKVQ